MPTRRFSRAAFTLALLVAALPWAAAAQAVYHILEKGETLYSVARAYGLKPDVIAKANSIDDPSKLRAGTKLLIPGARPDAPAMPNDATGMPDGPALSSDASAVPEDAAGAAQTAAQKYKVVKGDTLFSIARAYSVGLDSLRAANRLGPSSVIKPGDILSIPAGGKAPVSGSGGKASASGSGSKSAPTAPAMPDPVKTSVKAVSKGLSWPCPGEILYLDGKAYGVIIKAKQGEIERAVAAGVVSSAGPYRGYGNVVFVLSRTGHIYVYGGNDRIVVRAGDRVVAGQELGTVGIDAKQGGSAAYFLVFKNGEAVDPAEAPRDQ
jgi:murein DD-endopeptidase MepM/ murein hydrolase activator NlpD